MYLRNTSYGGIKLSLVNAHIRPLEQQQPYEAVAPSGLHECIVPNVSCWDR